MQRCDIELKAREIIAHCLCVSEREVVNEASLEDDLEMDDIDCVQLSMNLEDHFDILLPKDYFAVGSTVKDVFDLVEKNLN